jgi:hypothetical protein
MLQGVEEHYRGLFQKTGLLVAGPNAAATVFHKGAEHVSRTIWGELLPTIGKGLDAAREGYDGLILIGPFNCLPFRISEAILKPLSIQGHAHSDLRKRRLCRLPFGTQAGRCSHSAGARPCSEIMRLRRREQDAHPNAKRATIERPGSASTKLHSSPPDRARTAARSAVGADTEGAPPTAVVRATLDAVFHILDDQQLKAPGQLPPSAAPVGRSHRGAVRLRRDVEADTGRPLETAHDNQNDRNSSSSSRRFSRTNMRRESKGMRANGWSISLSVRSTAMPKSEPDWCPTSWTFRWIID